MTSLVRGKIIIVLDVDKNTPAAVLLEVATTVTTQMEAHKGTFPSPTPALATVRAAMTALTSAQSAFKANAGTRAERDQAWAALLGLVQQLRAYVEGVANESPEQAESIAAEAAMRVRRPGIHDKSDLRVTPIGSGAVKAVAKVVQGARANQFQYSINGGKDWIDVPTGTRATVTIQGLVPGSTITCRHRAITKTGPGDWSQLVTCIVT